MTRKDLSNQAWDDSNQGVPQKGIWKQVTKQIFTKSSLKQNGY